MRRAPHLRAARGKRRSGLWLILHAAALSGALRIISPRHDLVDADCEHDFVLGSTTGGELPLTFEANAHSPHGVAVYVDEKPVGVAHMWAGRRAGDFNLTGLAAGWHTLQVVLLDAAGQEQQRPFVSDTSIFKVSTVELALMDLPAPHILQRVRRGETFRIALIVVATGDYVHHLPLFAHSARAHFCRDHDVSLVALSDTRIPLDPGLDGYVRWLNVSAAKWPLPTLKKPHMVLQHWAGIPAHGFDFAFILDVDIIFVRPVGVEILHDTVACLHPGFFGKDRETFAYENDPTSSAYVPPAQGTHYYAGGFYGGRTPALHALLVELQGLTDRDLEHGRVARHHDESVLNRVLAL